MPGCRMCCTGWGGEGGGAGRGGAGVAGAPLAAVAWRGAWSGGDDECVTGRRRRPVCSAGAGGRGRSGANWLTAGGWGSAYDPNSPSVLWRRGGARLAFRSRRWRWRGAWFGGDDECVTGRRRRPVSSAGAGGSGSFGREWLTDGAWGSAYDPYSPSVLWRRRVAWLGLRSGRGWWCGAWSGGDEECVTGRRRRPVSSAGAGVGVVRARMADGWRVGVGIRPLLAVRLVAAAKGTWTLRYNG